MKKGVHSEVVIDDALVMLERSIRAIKTNNLIDLGRISNETIHNASIFQDDISKTLAILVLSIYKLEQTSMVQGVDLNLRSFAADLAEIHKNLQDAHAHKCVGCFEKIRLKIKKLGQKVFRQNIVNRAEVKKGGKIYDHGISLAQAAEVMGISQWELYDYIGKSKLNDYPEDLDTRVKTRVAYTRSLFT
jgi:hypothetical protein